MMTERYSGGKLRDHSFNCKNWKSNKAMNSWNMPLDSYFLQQGGTTFLNSTPNWKTSVQISEPMGDIFHSTLHSWPGVGSPVYVLLLLVNE